MYTKEQAGHKLCPHMDYTENPQSSYDATFEVRSQCSCYTDNCMAWRSETKQEWIEDLQDPRNNRFEYITKGWCGLSGRPTV